MVISSRVCTCKVIIIVVAYYFLTLKCQVFDCHDDPAFYPDDGLLESLQFTWLGVLQYIHIEKGNPHYFRVPRVVLITNQFVMSTAADAAEVPPGYALGNVVFGDYERDENECGIPVKEVDVIAQCDPAILVMPIADVLLHPEYKHFKIKNSIALMKLLTPVKSLYMLPVCLPYKNYLFNKYGGSSRKLLRHVDFPADAPRDFTNEEKEVTTIKLLPREVCYVYAPYSKHSHKKPNLTSSTHGRTVCSTNCGFHSGAPTVVHEHTGHWTIVTMAKGGPPCPDPMRSLIMPQVAHHIPIYPYLRWITSAITGKVVGAVVKDDPFGFAMARGTLRQAMTLSPYEKKAKRRGWMGHWWLGGLRCYDRGEAAEDMYRFYFDIFKVTPSPLKIVVMTHYLQIDAPKTTIIDCVKVKMPWFARTEPRVWDLHTGAVKIRLPVLRHKIPYRINIEAWGHNISTGASEVKESEPKQTSADAGGSDSSSSELSSSIEKNKNEQP